jgi:hypothetical protein
VSRAVAWFKKHGHWLLTVFVAFVFIQSLFFKFTGSPETVYIFQGKLDPWALAACLRQVAFSRPKWWARLN